MERRGFLKAASLLVGGLSLSQGGSGTADAKSGRPDVLFISIEDFSPHRLGCYGNPVCKTPNIDRLASEGLRFDLAHCSAAPCCPSRTSLLSGLRPETTGVFGNGDDWSRMLEPGTTMTEHFMANGYETVRVGKIYHRGNGNRIYDDTSRWNRIIEETEGIDRPRQAARAPRGPGVEYARKRAEARKKGIMLGGGSPFMYGPTGRDDLDETDGMLAEQGVRLLSQTRGDKPLFLALGFHKPHLAFTAPDKYFDMYPPEEMVLPKNLDTDVDGMPVDKSQLDEKNPHTLEQWREAIAAHYACLSFIDAQVGRVLDALERSGRADNTIVVLWSDHGFMVGEHFKWRKGQLYDHSVLVALIVKAPGVTRPGSVCKRPVESIDIFPTLFDLCGIPIPDGLEAISMKSVLENPDRPWKKGAITTHGTNDKSICAERWRYTEYGGPENAELFDRKNDPHELYNLAKEPKYAGTVARLSKLLAGGWRACLPES